MENVRDTLDKKTKDLAHAYEFILFCDGSLDNEVYNTFEACKKYDRESGNTPVLSTIFLNGRLSDVKDAPVMENRNMSMNWSSVSRCLARSIRLPNLSQSWKQRLQRAAKQLISTNNGACKDLSGTVMSHNDGSKDTYRNFPAEQ